MSLAQKNYNYWTWKLLLFSIIVLIVITAFIARRFFFCEQTKKSLIHEQFIKPVFKLDNPSSSGLQSNFYEGIPQKILVSKNKKVHLVNVFGNPRFRHDGDVSTLVFLPNGKIVMGGSDPTPLRGHLRHITSVAFSPDGTKIASGGYDSLVILWDIVTGKPIHVLCKDSGFPITNVAFSPDGTKILEGGTHPSCTVWDVSTGAKLYTVYGSSENTALMFSPDNSKIILVDGPIRIYGSSTGEKIRFVEIEGKFGKARLSHDGSKLATIAGIEQTWFAKIIEIWDINSSNKLHTLQRHEDIINDMVFSWDGKRFVSASRDGTIKLWDVTKEKEITTIKEEASAVALSPDGTKIISIGGKQTFLMKMWDANTGKEIDSIVCRSESECIQISPDGRWILTGNKDSTISLYKIEE